MKLSTLQSFTTIIALLASAVTAGAQTTITWTGGAGTTNYSDGANWSGGVAPNSTTSIAAFAGATPATVTLASDTVKQLNFSGSTAYTLSGSSVNYVIDVNNGTTSYSAISDSSTAVQTISTGVTFQNTGGTQNMQFNLSASSTLTFDASSSLTINTQSTSEANQSSTNAVLNILGGLTLNSGAQINWNHNGTGSVLNLNPTSFATSVSAGVIRAASSRIEIGTNFGTNSGTTSNVSFTLGGTGATQVGSSPYGGGQIYFGANGAGSGGNIAMGPTNTGVTGTYTLGSNASTAAATSETGNIQLTAAASAGTENYVFDTATTNTLTLSGNITASSTAPTGNTLNINKTGAGTLVLTGTGNTYSNTGAVTTTISAGTLLANNASGSATGSGAVTLAGGATIGGTGTITGAISASAASNSIIAPGILAGSTGLTAATGTLNLTGGLTATTGLTLSLNMNGTSAFSQVNLGSGAFTAPSLTLNIFNLNNGTIAANTLYTVMTGTGTWSAISSGSITFNTLPSGFSGATAFYTTGPTNTLQIEFTAVPEPGTWALLGFGTLLLVMQVRRQRFPRRA